MADMAYQVFVALDGTALEGGRIFIGSAYSDPESSPLTVYWDEALSVPAAQPLLTSGGVIVRDGTPAEVYSAQPLYSIRVRDRSGSVVWYKSVTGADVTATRLTFPIPGGLPGDKGDKGDKGDPGGAANIALGRAQLKAAVATTGDIWTLSEEGRTGEFRLMPDGFTPLSDPNEGVYIINAAGRVFERIYTGRLDFRWFGAVPDGVPTADNNNLRPGFTDNTAAIQATLDFNFLRGGGAVGGPSGIYGLSSAPTNRNGQFNVLHAPGIPDITKAQTCEFRGDTPPVLSGVTNNGCILWSTFVSNTDLDHNSVIGCRANGPGGISYIALRLVNLIVRQPQNPALYGVNADNCHIFDRENLRVDIAGGIATAGELAVLTVSEPIHPTVGVVTPRNNVPYRSSVRNCVIFGYYYGVRWGELVTGDGEGLSACKVGILIGDGYHPSHVSFVEFISCGKQIQSDTTDVGQEIYIDLITIEKSHNVPSWIVYGEDINDPLDKIQGIITYHEHESELQHIAPFNVIGARKLRIDHVFSQDQAGRPYSRIFPTFYDFTAASSVRERMGTASATAWDLFNADTDDVTATVGAASHSNFGGPAPVGDDYRISQVSVLFDGDLRSGARLWGTANGGVYKDHLQINRLGHLRFLTAPGVYADETAARAAGLPQGTVFEKPDGSLWRQRTA